MNEKTGTDSRSQVKPCVSVIIPAYNRENTINRAITSVLEQTLTDLELIVINDGSTDQTLETIQSFSDDRIKIVNKKINRGANAARNSGIEESNGDYISFLDSDDELHKEHLEKSIQRLKQGSDKCEGVFTSFKKVSAGKTVEKRRANEREVSLKYIEDGNQIGTLSCTTFKSEIFDYVGLFDESLPASQDFDIYLRILDNYSMIGLDDILVTKYNNGDQIGDHIDRKEDAFRKIQQKHKDSISKNCISDQYRTLGRLYANQGRMSDARLMFKKSIKRNPENIGSYYLYILSIFGVKTFEQGAKIGITVRFHFNTLRNICK